MTLALTSVDGTLVEKIGPELPSTERQKLRAISRSRAS